MDPRQSQGRTVIRAGRVIDPSQSIDRVDDVTIVDGRIESVGPAAERPDRTIDAGGLIVCPGLIDMHVHLREPGGEEQETIETGTRAAAGGGFTAVACMPNTKPPIDNVDTLRAVLDKARSGAHCRVYPVAAMTVGQRGQVPVDMPALKAAGAIAFSDDGIGLDDDRVARAVFDRARPCDALLIQHCEVAALSAGGCVNQGRIAEQLGVAGIDPRAETEMLARDLDLLRGSPVRYHVAHVSTERAVDLVRRGKAEGLPVTAEVTVHHLALTEDAVLRQGANAKMKPPLRTEADVAACRRGLCDGTIDCIATDHAPHTAEAKERGLRDAPFGVVGLETAWPVSWGVLVETGRLDPAGLIDRMSCQPARILGLSDQGTLAAGTVADVTMLDATASWVLSANSLISKSNNSPFIGRHLVGRCVATLVAGVCRYVAEGSEGRFAQPG
ncbi:MAG: dihydroorotase [Phycisphaerales bacterium]|nr:MAG: dihydroorotase [Phycisphaerales bacterium]